MFRFENPYYLYLLLLIPVLLAVYMLMQKWRKRAIQSFADATLFSALVPDLSESRGRWKIILQLIAFAFLVIGIANPQVGTKLEEARREGIDLMVALDISNSMLAQDVQPNRLARAKQVLSKLIDQLEGDRFGLVVFAGEAYVQLPMTTDYSAAKLFLDNISPSLISTQGTAIGAAVELCTRSLIVNEKGNKAIVIISDGENHEDDALAAVDAAREKNIKVFTMGIGSPNGAPIPVKTRSGMVSYKKDKQGNTVVSRLNESMLQQLAAQGDGTYARITGSQSAQNVIKQELNKLEKTELSSKTFSDYEDQFQYFVAVSLLLLTADFFLTRRKSKLSGRFKLFGEEKNA